MVAAKLLQRKVTTMWQVVPASQACGQSHQASLVRYGFALSDPAGRDSTVLLRSDHPSEEGWELRWGKPGVWEGKGTAPDVCALQNGSKGLRFEVIRQRVALQWCLIQMQSKKQACCNQADAGKRKSHRLAWLKSVRKVFCKIQLLHSE